MPISVVFDPPLPSDSPSTFNTKAFTLLGDLNDWSTQANALPGEVATNLTTLLAAPPAIGSTTPAAVSATTLTVKSGAMGYGIGAGGTVTQATSKSTAVTLNKPSGQITMHNAALAAGDFETFYLYSSYITDTSVLLVQGIHDGTVNPANYTISCVQIYGATNRALIKVVNTSAGSLSEAVVLRFAVISGANT